MTIPWVKDTETSEAEIANRDCHCTSEILLRKIGDLVVTRLKKLLLMSRIVSRSSRLVLVLIEMLSILLQAIVGNLMIPMRRPEQSIIVLVYQRPWS